MFKNMSIRLKLLILVGIPLISTIVNAILATFYVNKIASDLKQKLFDEGFQSISLILNADRDMYQALTAFDQLSMGDVDANDRDSIIGDIKENIGQVDTRVSDAEKILKQDEATWGTYRGTASDTNLYKIFADFYVNFNDWKFQVDEAINHGQTPEDFMTSFDTAREDLNVIGEIVEQGIQDAMDKADANRSTMVVSIIVIVCVMLVLSSVVATIILRYLVSSFSKVSGALSLISDGNLDVEVQVESRDEIGDMGVNLNKMAENLNMVINNISSAAEQVASGAKQVSDSSMALSQGATEQASAIEELTASLEEISTQTVKNAENANQASNLAESARQSAALGNEQMGQMLTAMDDINEASSNISKIIKVIDDIAFQTNILALNAAVEAARAGQHGKGFAVVAEEVRNLAARSANAAKETTTLIEGSIRKVEGGTKIAKETAVALGSIVDEVSRVSQLVNDIAKASNEQAAGISQINQGLVQVSEVVQNNSATSEESAAASEELAGQAEMLKDQVARFNLRRKMRSGRGYDSMNPEMLRMLEDMLSKEREPENKPAPIEKNEPKAAPKVNGAGSGRKKTSESKKTITLSDKEFGKY
jgi:methyl-accepting chemotaxis protein